MVKYSIPSPSTESITREPLGKRADNILFFPSVSCAISSLLITTESLSELSTDGKYKPLSHIPIQYNISVVSMHMQTECMSQHNVQYACKILCTYSMLSLVYWLS